VLGQQVEQDRQLRLVVEITRDELERVGVERREQLLVAEAQQLLKVGRATQSRCFSQVNGTRSAYRALEPIRPLANRLVAPVL
jgi:hypothetical protein